MKTLVLAAVMVGCGVGCLYLLMLAIRPGADYSYVVAAVPLGILCLALFSALSHPNR